MTPTYFEYVERALAAERAGDISMALEWHQSIPMFRRGRHRALLERLATLGDDLPDWVWARLLVYLAFRCEDGDAGGIVRRRLQEVTEALHGDLMADCYQRRDDPIRVFARVAGESWAFHQRAAYDAGGLTAFIDEFVTGRLAERSDLARTWAESRMSGYELGESRCGARLAVREADGGGWLDVLDLGARACAPGGWVLGRLVPSGVGDRLMFEMPPLEVPAEVAREVAARARQRADAWWDVVTAARAAGVVSPDHFLREDYEFTTDVLDLDLLRFGTPPGDLSRVTHQLRSGRDEVSRAAYRILERARRGDVAAADQAYVGSALLKPRAFDDVRRRLLRTDDSFSCLDWADWADRLLEPSRGRVLALARLERPAA